MIEFLRSNTIILVAVILIAVFLVLFLVIKYSKSKTATVTKVFGIDKPAEGEEKPETKRPDDNSGEPLEKEGEDEEDEEKEGPDEAGEGSEAGGSSDTSEGAGSESGEGAETGESTETGDLKQKKSKAKEKKVKSIEKVFKRDETPDEEVSAGEPEAVSSISEEELLSKMGFVKDSKKVSKLVKLSEQEKAALEEMAIEQETAQAMPIVTEEPQVEAPQTSKYFNRSKRLSKFIEQNNFDDMFGSHISDRYLNIDASRHLDVTDEKTNRLYERASKTVANSDVRLVYGGDENGANLKRDKKLEESYIEKRKREIFAEMIESKSSVEPETNDYIIDENSIDDEIKLDSKTVLVSDAILRRKGKNKK